MDESNKRDVRTREAMSKILATDDAVVVVPVPLYRLWLRELDLYTGMAEGRDAREHLVTLWDRMAAAMPEGHRYHDG